MATSFVQLRERPLRKEAETSLAADNSCRLLPAQCQRAPNFGPMWRCVGSVSIHTATESSVPQKSGKRETARGEAQERRPLSGDRISVASARPCKRLGVQSRASAFRQGQGAFRCRRAARGDKGSRRAWHCFVVSQLSVLLQSAVPRGSLQVPALRYNGKARARARSCASGSNSGEEADWEAVTTQLGLIGSGPLKPAPRHNRRQINEASPKVEPRGLDSKRMPEPPDSKPATSGPLGRDPLGPTSPPQGGQ